VSSRHPLQDTQDKTEPSAWLGNGTVVKPDDLGYWVGHRIAKSDYHHATDRRQAELDTLINLPIETFQQCGDRRLLAAGECQSRTTLLHRNSNRHD